jgi:hypothetical protein
LCSGSIATAPSPASKRLAVTTDGGQLFAEELERVQAQLPEPLACVQHRVAVTAGSTSPDSAVISASVQGVGTTSADRARAVLDQLRASR